MRCSHSRCRCSHHRSRPHKCQSPSQRDLYSEGHSRLLGMSHLHRACHTHGVKMSGYTALSATYTCSHGSKSCKRGKLGPRWLGIAQTCTTWCPHSPTGSTIECPPQAQHENSCSLTLQMTWEMHHNCLLMWLAS